MKSIDVFLGHVAAGVLTTLLYFCFATVTLLTLISVPADMFEYGDGISDLDILEVVTMVLFILVTWRYVWRCRLQNCSWWQQIRRFCFVVATCTLIELSFFLLVVIGLSEFDQVLTIDLPKARSDGWTVLVNWTLILCIYAAAPLPKLFARKSDEPMVDEPSSEQPEQEEFEPCAASSSDSEQPQEQGAKS